MPATNFPEYARSVEDTLHRVLATGEAVLVTLKVDQRSSVRGFIAGSMEFHDGSMLHFREFVDTNQAEQKIMYAYHYQDANHNLIFRYDNAAHRPALPYPAYKHTGSDVQVSLIPTLAGVLDQILKLRS